MKIENGNKKDAQISNLKRLSSIELNTNVKKIFYESRPKKKILFGLDTPDFFHMKEILDAFAFTTGKLNPYSQIAQNMIQHHLRVRHLDKTTLISQLSLLASVIAEFAGSQYIFACLCKEDQKILLQNNIPLYLQYILAQYFSSCSGLEQISWILEGQVSLQTIEDVTNLNLITLSELNAAVCLYNSSTLVQLYQHFSDNIRLHYPFPQHCNGLIAYVLLFQTNQTMLKDLAEPNRIKCIFDDAKNIIKLGQDSLDQSVDIQAEEDLGVLIHTLEKMKKIFESCQLDDNEVDMIKNLPIMLTINYTETEEAWIQNQFSLLQTEYISVTPPKDYFEQLIKLLLYNTPVGENFVATWMGMVFERARRGLKIHAEFNNLSDVHQEQLWGRNYKTAMAISVAQVNVVRTGKDQLRNVLGYLNSKETDWEIPFRSIIPVDDLKCAYLHHAQVNKGRLNEAEMAYFFELMKDIAAMVSNDQLFQLFTLLTLLDPEDLPDQRAYTGVAKMRRVYLKLFQRKLMSAGCSFVDYATFKRALFRVKKFAVLLMRFLEI